MTLDEKTNEFGKMIKFVVRTTKKQESILNRITARQTYVVKLYLELLKKEEDTIRPTVYGWDKRIRELTILTRNRTKVKYDFKKLTNLNTTSLGACFRQAVKMYNSYKTHLKKWERSVEKTSIKYALRMCCDLSFDENGSVISYSEETDSFVNLFSTFLFWKRMMKKKPSEPCSVNTKNKIPVFIRTNCNILYYEREKSIAFRIIDNTMLIRISTLRKGEPLELELQLSEYHKKAMQNSRLTGGLFYKNNVKKRWEFHAYIREKLPAIKIESQQKVILGIDLGINTDATVVALIDGLKIKQEHIHFLKEGDLRQRKYNIEQRKKTLKRLRDTNDTSKRNYAIQELKALKGKIRTITTEMCHRISRKITDIAQSFALQGYEVHVAIGKLKGIQSVVRRNAYSKKNRSRRNMFPYAKLTDFITYKCYSAGIRNVLLVKENFTSKTCHKCDSKNTARPTQAQLKCHECGLQYHADVNGAINIAKKYLTMIFSHEESAGKGKSFETSAQPQGISDAPSYNELTGTTVQEKVNEVRKEIEC